MEKLCKLFSCDISLGMKCTSTILIFITINNASFNEIYNGYHCPVINFICIGKCLCKKCLFFSIIRVELCFSLFVFFILDEKVFFYSSVKAQCTCKRNEHFFSSDAAMRCESVLSRTFHNIHLIYFCHTVISMEPISLFNINKVGNVLGCSCTERPCYYCRHLSSCKLIFRCNNSVTLTMHDFVYKCCLHCII